VKWRKDAAAGRIEDERVGCEATHRERSDGGSADSEKFAGVSDRGKQGRQKNFGEILLPPKL
jgi:hypothetical protein